MILYAGNKLSKFGYTPTCVETLTPKLSEMYEIISVSDKKNQILRLLDMISKLLKNKKRIDAVIIDSYSTRGFWFTYILARLCVKNKIPVIPYLHGGGYPERLESSPGKCFEIFSNSYKNISPSIYLKKHFEEKGYEVECIPNFISINEYEFKKRTEVSPKLLWVRSFDKTYNPLLAIEILQKLKLNYPEAELCMVGPDKDGSLQEVKDRANELKVSGSLKITGKLSKKEWLELSKEYDIFINTTDYDNQPVSVIEAMAMGLPVISTNVGGIPFLIDDGNNGLLVPRNDADKFVKEIERLLTDNELVSKLSDNGRKKAESFDWDNLKKKWKELLDPLINKN